MRRDYSIFFEATDEQMDSLFMDSGCQEVFSVKWVFVPTRKRLSYRVVLRVYDESAFVIPPFHTSFKSRG